MNWFFPGFALILALWFFALLYLKSYVRRRTDPDHILVTLQEEVRQLEADIDEKTEQDLQLLEEKIRQLREACAGADRACADAERRIAVLTRELERRKTESRAFVSLDRTAAPVSAAAYTAGSRGKKHSLLEKLEITEPEKKSPPKITVSRELTPKPPPLKERIAELHHAGFSAELIAERLGLTVGETELYIAMERPNDIP
ncbi:MAG: hypothetical protein LBK77_08850 [Spirochaetaceae bacterium]|jgi:septal ring factor EnvC (AmiA/AmiB activator)|nr:hypothetical protein [Spirochaetaceae bacterium]